MASWHYAWSPLRCGDRDPDADPYRQRATALGAEAPREDRLQARGLRRGPQALRHHARHAEVGQVVQPFNPAAFLIFGKETRSRLLSRGHRRLVQPEGPGLGGGDHDGGRLLCRSIGGSARALRKTGDFQHRPRQSAQFTSLAFTSMPHREQIAISMDGRGAWRDNVVVERL